MPSIRRVAISKILKSARPVQLIVLGRENEIPDCYVEGMRQLCVRETSMTLEEGEEIGLETVIKIAQGRDLHSKGREWSEIIAIAGISIMSPSPQW